MSSQQHPLISAPVAAVPMSSATSAAFGSGSGPVAPPRTGATSPVSASRPNRPQSPPVVVRASSAIPDDDAVPLAESEYNINKITEIQASFVGGQSLLAPGRVFLHEGTLLKQCRKSLKPRYFVMFNDLLVYGTSLAKGRYAKQVALELDQMTVTAQCHYLPTVYDSENNIDFDAMNGFQISHKTKSFHVISHSAADKAHWLSLLQQYIEKATQKKGKVPLSHVAAVWVPDAKVTTCMVCQNSKFTTFNRKHHCRNCGKVACGNCTSQSWLLPMSSKPQRVCDECVALLKKSSAGASSPAITATPSSAAAPVPAAAAAAPRPQPAPRRPKPPPAVPTASSTANGPSSPSAPANDDDSGSGTDSDDDTSDTDAEDEPQPSARPQSAPRPAAPAPAQRTSRFGDLDQTMKAVVNQQALEAKGAMEKDAAAAAANTTPAPTAPETTSAEPTRRPPVGVRVLPVIGAPASATAPAATAEPTVACTECGIMLKRGDFAMLSEKPYCKPHFKVNFAKQSAAAAPKPSEPAVVVPAEPVDDGPAPVPAPRKKKPAAGSTPAAPVAGDAAVVSAASAPASAPAVVAVPVSAEPATTTAAVTEPVEKPAPAAAPVEKPVPLSMQVLQAAEDTPDEAVPETPASEPVDSLVRLNSLEQATAENLAAAAAAAVAAAAAAAPAATAASAPVETSEHVAPAAAVAEPEPSSPEGQDSATAASAAAAPGTARRRGPRRPKFDKKEGDSAGSEEPEN